MKLTQEALTVEVGGSSGIRIYHDGSLYEDYWDTAKIESGEIIPLPKLVFDEDALVGLDSIPSMRRDNTPRPTSHGVFSERGFTEGRLLSLTGHAIGENLEQLDSLRNELASYLNTGELITINILRTTEELSRTMQGYLEGSLDWTWTYDNYASFKFDLICPNPRMFATEQRSVQIKTSDRIAAAGLNYQMTYPLTFSRTREKNAPGVLQNEGNSESYLQIIVPGPNGGFTIKDNKSNVIRYTGNVARGSSVIIDTYSGTALLNGEDSSHLLTRRDWITVPPKQKGGVIKMSIDFDDDSQALENAEDSLVATISYRDTWI